MAHHEWSRRIAAGALLAVALGVTAAGQGPAKESGTSSTGGSWSVPLTPWGHPDLQGIWNNGTTTPLERPDEFAGREFLTDTELKERTIEAATRAERRPDNARADVDLAYNNEWWDRGAPLKRTSLIVDPADGKLPPLTDQGKKRVAARDEARRGRGPADSWEDRPLQERCLVYHGVPPFPTGYNNNYQIAQTPDYVAIRYEMLAETRFIPLDGRPHLGPRIRQWMGDSRGHWEGTTLVVETTDYSDKTTFRFPAANDSLRVVERFTRTSKDLIDSRFTVDNPAMYTRPWTAVLPLASAKGPLYEYACHEGNYGMSGVLSGHRAEEKAAQDGTSSSAKQ
jgi:hypothetical protein